MRVSTFYFLVLSVAFLATLQVESSRLEAKRTTTSKPATNEDDGAAETKGDDDRETKKEEDVTRGNGGGEEKSDLPRGKSRADGGVFSQNPPSWLAPVWSREPHEHSHGNWQQGHHSGNALIFDDQHLLMHQDTVTQFHKTPSYPNWSIPDKFNPHDVLISEGKGMVRLNKILHPAPVSFDHHQRELDMGYAISDYERTGGSSHALGNSPFSLYKMNFQKFTGEPNFLSHHDKPILERDVNQFGKNCHVNTWSNSPWSGSRASPTDNERKFVKIRVQKKGDCNNGHCTLFTADAGRHHICDGIADLGAPVTCGPENKVTYLVKGHKEPGRHCSREVDAYHVPHLVSDLNDHLYKGK